ncbi:MAG: hypothetical protein ACRCR2_08070 [Fusobacteriaceae bacterium]
MSNICKKCLRLENDKCTGWLSPEGCSPIYSPAKYKRELESMVSYYRRNASVGATSRLIQELSPKIAKLDKMMYEGISETYREDTSRGSGGGKSESDANAATSRKAKMKDNRPIDVKMRKQDIEAVKEELEKFEEEHGKLDKISSYNIMSRSKIDSYTGEEIKETKIKKKRKKVK